MLSVLAFFSQWHMYYIFFVLHHRWRKNSSQWGIYRYQPSGNFEENQRGHRKKRDKKVAGKNFTGDEGLGSGLEQELMPDYPHHLHFHWNRRCCQLRIYLHTIRMLDLFQDRNGLLECDFGTLQFVITDHKFVLVLCTVSENFLRSEMPSPPPASRRRNLTGVSARDPWTITRPKQRQLWDVRGVRVYVVTAEVWQREPMLRFCKLVACWMSNEPCSSTIAHSSHPPHPHFTGICISLSLTLSRACLSHR